MQTFLPYPDFQASASALDYSRCGKQRTETFQILLANRDEWAIEERKRRAEAGIIRGTDPMYSSWANHPAAKMWVGYGDALRHYLNVFIQEWVSRGYNNTMSFAPVPDEVVYPDWLGDDEVHASHRSRLLFKGKVDVLKGRLRTYGIKREARKWLRGMGVSHEWSMFTEEDYQAVTAHLDELGAEPASESNFYEQHNWTEPDSIPYIWPCKSLS